MSVPDLLDTLAARERRAPCSESERRAAALLRDRVRAAGGAATLEVVWVHPAWAPAQILCLAALIAGGILGVNEPLAGLALWAPALAALYGELSGRFMPLRRLFPARATQNVLAPLSATTDDQPEPRRRSRLVLCAGLDAPRGGAFAPWIPTLLAGATAAAVALGAVLGARQAGVGGQAIGIVQLTVMLVLLVAVAVLSDTLWSQTAPGGASAAALAAALELGAELRHAPPRNLDVELVLAGAATGPALGIAAHLKKLRRAGRRGHDTVTLSIEPLAPGDPCWRRRDGLLAPVRYHPRLLEICAQIASAEPRLRARALSVRGYGQAMAARRRGWPALAIGTAADGDAAASPAQIAAVVEFALAVVSALDADLG